MSKNLDINCFRPYSSRDEIDWYFVGPKYMIFHVIISATKTFYTT